MATIDQKTVLKPVSALDISTITSDTTTNGTIIDLKGFESVTLFFKSGAIAAGTATPSFTEGNDAALADGATVAVDDLIGTVASVTYADTDDNVNKWIGYRGKKRYLRVDIVTTGTTTGTVISCDAILGTPHKAPTV